MAARKKKEVVAKRMFNVAAARAQVIAAEKAERQRKAREAREAREAAEVAQPHASANNVEHKRGAYHIRSLEVQKIIVAYVEEKVGEGFSVAAALHLLRYSGISHCHVQGLLGGHAGNGFCTIAIHLCYPPRFT